MQLTKQFKIDDSRELKAIELKNYINFVIKKAIIKENNTAKQLNLKFDNIKWETKIISETNRLL